MELVFDIRAYGAQYKRYAERTVRLSAETAADLVDVVVDMGPGLVALIQKTVTEAAAKEGADDGKAE